MKVVVVKLALDDDAKVVDLLASVLDHVKAVRGVAILGGDASTILVSAAKDDAANGRWIAELLAAEGEIDEGTVHE